jgi:hypothetical protein
LFCRQFGNLKEETLGKRGGTEVEVERCERGWKARVYERP